MRSKHQLRLALRAERGVKGVRLCCTGIMAPGVRRISAAHPELAVSRISFHYRGKKTIGRVQVRP
jgi:hypothetical protein